METSSQRTSDAQFRTVRNGYEASDVDAYVARASSAISQLQNQVREMRQRLHDAESKAVNAGETEDTLRRTLVLAQKTADAAIAEARSESDSIVSDAQRRADQLLRDAEFDAERRVREAESQATLLRAEAEREARRVVEATRQPLLEEIRDLEQLRNYLTDDIALLEESLDANRTRVRAVIEQLSVLVEAPDRMRVAPTPALSGVALDDTGDSESAVEQWVDDTPDGWTDDVGAWDDDEPDVVPEPVEPALPVEAQIGAPTEALTVIDLREEPQRDTFYNELRSAVADPPEPEDAAMASFFDTDDEEPDRRPRFGRRR